MACPLEFVVGKVSGTPFSELPEVVWMLTATFASGLVYASVTSTVTGLKMAPAV